MSKKQSERVSVQIAHWCGQMVSAPPPGVAASVCPSWPGSSDLG